MNAFFDFGRHAAWRPRAGALCLLSILVAGGGCGKSANSTPPAASPPVANTPAATNAPPAADSTTAAAAPVVAPPPARMQPSVPSVSANGGLTQLQMLNRAMLGWEMKNHRHPRTFDEFASTAGMQIPAPPAGQKYAFNQKGYIVLVSSTPIN